MGKDWTIDTWVLYRAADVDLKAAHLLMRILQERNVVTFDFEGHIQGEYERCLARTRGQGGNDLLRKMITEIVAKCAQRFSGKLQGRHRKALESLHFHRDDFPFVAVCSKSRTRRLVSEDSDYTDPEVRHYLASEMKIDLMSLNASVDALTE